MNEFVQRCAECGSELPRGTPRGMCPNCALKGALELSEDDSTLITPALLAPAAGERIGLDRPAAVGDMAACREFGRAERPAAHAVLQSTCGASRLCLMMNLTDFPLIKITLCWPKSIVVACYSKHSGNAY